MDRPYKFSILLLLVAVTLPGHASAQGSEGGERARNSVQSALNSLQELRDAPDVQELTTQNKEIASLLNGLSRDLKAAERQIYGELSLSAEGIARDMTFHLFALSRDLNKIASLDAVLVDVEALLEISTEYQSKHDEWMALRSEADTRVNLYTKEYIEKVNRFRTYCPDLCEDAFKEIERSNGSTRDGRLIVQIINEHMRQPNRLTRNQVLRDTKEAFEIE